MIGIALAVHAPDRVMLAAQLESLRQQTHTDWVCHITCDSPVEPMHMDDARIVWHAHASRLGHARNFWAAIQQCAANPAVTAIACCDQDDLWEPHRLAATSARLSVAPPLSLVHSDLTPFVDGDTVSTEGSPTVWTLEHRQVEGATPLSEMIRSTVNGTTLLVDAALVRRFPELPATVRHHDQWLAVLSAAHGGVYPIHESLVRYRQHGANVSGVTPYRGRAALPTAPLQRMARRYQELRDISAAVQAVGLDVSPITRWRLLAIAWRHWGRDPVLARASLAKWIGSWIPASLADPAVAGARSQTSE